MHWKIPWQQKKPPATERRDNFYSRLREEIGEIRRQGDFPVRDGESFSRYVCDLCHRASPVSSLRQCVICGRWACPECWKEEYYVCSSCSGIIRLHQIGFGQESPGCGYRDPDPDPCAGTPDTGK